MIESILRHGIDFILFFFLLLHASELVFFLFLFGKERLCLIYLNISLAHLPLKGGALEFELDIDIDVGMTCVCVWYTYPT